MSLPLPEAAALVADGPKAFKGGLVPRQRGGEVGLDPGQRPRPTEHLGHNAEGDGRRFLFLAEQLLQGLTSLRDVAPGLPEATQRSGQAHRRL